MQKRNELSIILLMSLIGLQQLSAEKINCTASWFPWSKCFRDPVSGYQWRDRMTLITPGSQDGMTCSEYVNNVQTKVCDGTTPDETLPTYGSIDCGDWFKCDNGRCIRKDLACNGDDDCGDASDEYPTYKGKGTVNCTNIGNYICGIPITTSTGSTPPKSDRFFLGIPGIEKFSSGYDLLTGTFRGDVLSMRPFGSCRRILKSGEIDYYYRLPNNVNSFSQRTTIEDGAGTISTSGAELITSTQTLLREVSTFGGILGETESNVGYSQSQKFMGYVLDSVETDNKYTTVTSTIKVKISGIKLKAAQHLEPTDVFFVRLFDLPTTEFSYDRYMALIEDFGTHYVSSGTLGGEFSQTNVYDRCWLEDEYETEYDRIEWMEDLVFCDRENMRAKLKPTYTVSSRCLSITSINVESKVINSEIDVLGGDVSAASNLQVSLTSETWNAWVDTVSDHPSLILDDFKLEPISSLMDIPNPMFSEEDRASIKANIELAIKLYLEPYDATVLCGGAQFDNNCYDRCIDDDDEVRNKTVRYLGGKGGYEYKCQCACTSRPYECGSLRESTTVFTIFICLFVAIKSSW